VRRGDEMKKKKTTTTTTATSSTSTPRTRPSDRRAPRAATVAVLCLGACGPDVDEPPQAQDWMIGLFSSREHGEHGDSSSVLQYHVFDSFELDLVGVRANGPEDASVLRRTWEPRGDDAWAMFPNEKDHEIILEWMIQPKDGAPAECGPYEVVTVIGPGGDYPGPQSNPDPLYRGAVCPRSQECPPDAEDPDNCGELGFVYEWCDEPPSPCEVCGTLDQVACTATDGCSWRNDDGGDGPGYCSLDCYSLDEAGCSSRAECEWTTGAPRCTWRS
jgi:hypothetical protein